MTKLSKAVVAGHLEGLRALRGRLAAEIDACDSSRDVAALSARLVDVLERIAVLEVATKGTEGTALDELRRRRAERESAATG